MYMRVYASLVLFIFSSILLSMNCHTDYDPIDGRIAGNRRPYPDIFQRSIKSPKTYKLYQTHYVGQAKMVNKIYKFFLLLSHLS